MGVNGRMEAYGKYGWMILFASAALGIFGGVALMFPSDLTAQSARDLWLTRAWGITWVGFNIFALAVIVGPYRRGERWAWYTLWLLPLLLLSYFVLLPEFPIYLILTVLTALGLILSYRTFFYSGSEEQPSRVESTPEDLSPKHYDE